MCERMSEQEPVKRDKKKQRGKYQTTQTPATIKKYDTHIQTQTSWNHRTSITTTKVFHSFRILWTIKLVWFSKHSDKTEGREVTRPHCQNAIMLKMKTTTHSREWKVVCRFIIYTDLISRSLSISIASQCVNVSDDHEMHVYQKWYDTGIEIK